MLISDEAVPPSSSAIGMLLLAFLLVTWFLSKRHHVLTVWLLNFGVLGLTLLSMRWFPRFDGRYALVLPILISSLALGSGATLIATLFSSLVLLWTTPHSWPLPYPFPIVDEVGLWGLAILLLISNRPRREMIAWSWQGYEQARVALEQARDRQVDLKQALEDLAQANRETIRLNEMLSAARQAVEEARRAKEEFVANVSHELRTPLNMIIGFSDMILESPEVYAHELPSALLADVSAIRRNSEHLAALVDDVLAVSEVDTGHMKLLKEYGPFSEIVHEATETISVLFEKKGLTLTTDLPESIPYLYCDRTRIRQVLLNLLSNAVRFTQVGGARVAARVEKGALCVSVADTGSGLSPDKLERLFQPFQQADQSIRRRYGGTGLGLAISKRFIEMHDGKIWLESEPGKGTTALFTLPLSEDLGGRAAQRWFDPYHEYSLRTRRPGVMVGPPRPRIIVVEQGEALCQLISSYSDNLEPVRVSSLEEASNAVETEAAAGVIMNDASAAVIEYSEHLLNMPFSVPILLCWVPEHRKAASTIGAEDYLIKPVRRSELVEAIRRIAPDARSVLIADDDPESRRLFGRMLASSPDKYVVLHARDGASTLHLLRERKPDLVLLDLVMPNGDGLSVLEAKSQDSDIADIPVIILSATDPQREPLISRTLLLSRPEGLSAQDLVLTLEAVTRTLKPRFGAPERPEKLGA